MSKTADPSGRQVFRSPSAVVIWWLWVLFAVGNLVDLVIAGRDYLSVVAAFSLLAVTGVVYVTAQRPRIIADADGLTIVNPVRVHRVGWAAIAGFDKTDLLRVRCEWPAGGAAAEMTVPGTLSQDRTAAGELARGGAVAGTLGEGGTAREKRAIYAWAARSSIRGQIAAQARAERQVRRGRAAGDGRFGRGGTLSGGPPPDSVPPPASLGLDAAKVAVALTERVEKARAAAPDARAVPPVSTWHWPAVAAVVVPAIALLIAVLA